jgi:hypothetical protein
LKIEILIAICIDGIVSQQQKEIYSKVLFIANAEMVFLAIAGGSVTIRSLHFQEKMHFQ